MARAPPGTSRVRRNDTHRLIHSKYSARGSSVLAGIVDSTAHLADIFDLDNATNDRLRAEKELLSGIGVRELLFGVSYYRVVNAAFTHAHPLGSRFNGPDRGAWYTAFDTRTAQAEVAFHKTVQFAERLLAGGSLGIVYPGVRRAGGTCLACFRPALVMNVRKGTTYRFRWSGQPTPIIAAVKSAPDKRRSRAGSRREPMRRQQGAH